MNPIVLYKSKYGSTRQYAEWIAEELKCEAKDAKGVKADDLLPYDTIIYGGGLYAEVINGITLITKNMEKLSGKRIFVFTTAITPLDCREYYEGEVLEKNFKNFPLERIKIYNFLGKMKKEELSFVHRNALKALKKIMSAKENPSDMIKLLIELCDFDDDLTDKNAIYPMINDIKNKGV